MSNSIDLQSISRLPAIWHAQVRRGWAGTRFKGNTHPDLGLDLAELTQKPRNSACMEPSPPHAPGLRRADGVILGFWATHFTAHPDRTDQRHCVFPSTRSIAGLCIT